MSDQDTTSPFYKIDADIMRALYREGHAQTFNLLQNRLTEINRNAPDPLIQDVISSLKNGNECYVNIEWFTGKGPFSHDPTLRDFIQQHLPNVQETELPARVAESIAPKIHHVTFRHDDLTPNEITRIKELGIHEYEQGDHSITVHYSNTGHAAKLVDAISGRLAEAALNAPADEVTSDFTPPPQDARPFDHLVDAAYHLKRAISPPNGFATRDNLRPAIHTFLNQLEPEPLERIISETEEHTNAAVLNIPTFATSENSIADPIERTAATLARVFSESFAKRVTLLSYLEDRELLEDYAAQNLPADRTGPLSITELSQIQDTFEQDFLEQMAIATQLLVMSCDNLQEMLNLPGDQITIRGTLYEGQSFNTPQIRAAITPENGYSLGQIIGVFRENIIPEMLTGLQDTLGKTTDAQTYMTEHTAAFLARQGDQVDFLHRTDIGSSTRYRAEKEFPDRPPPSPEEFLAAYTDADFMGRRHPTEIPGKVMVVGKEGGTLYRTDQQQVALFCGGMGYETELSNIPNQNVMEQTRDQRNAGESIPNVVIVDGREKGIHELIKDRVKYGLDTLCVVVVSPEENGRQDEINRWGLQNGTFTPDSKGHNMVAILTHPVHMGDLARTMDDMVKLSMDVKRDIENAPPLLLTDGRTVTREVPRDLEREQANNKGEKGRGA